MTDTTVRTSSTRAYQRYVAARQATIEAASVYGGQHTKANKLAWQKAQAEELRALMNYHQSKIMIYKKVLGQ